MSNTVRVRFAPSPTGPLHIGGVRTALYNYLFARKHGGTFLLRIEDTDQTRYVPGAEDYVKESLEWTGLNYDEGPGKEGDCGPYRQSERKALYRQYADQLVEAGYAYYAFDTPEDLEKAREDAKKQGLPNWQYSSVTRQYMKNSESLSSDDVRSRMDAGEPYVIRIKMPRNEEVKLQDMIRGWVTFQSNQLDDKVLYKADGMPTYHLANVVDDYLMKISHVIRGEEWLPSAPLHVMLYKYLGWEDSMPQFAHLPLILRPDGNGKLSKRDGDRLGFPVFPLNWEDPETREQTHGFRERGFFPEAVVNFLAFLGWNPGTEQEIFSLDELIETFTVERIGKSGARFDFDKAMWFNQQYFKQKSPADMATMIQPILNEQGMIRDEAFVEEFARLMVERVTFVNDFWTEGYYFFKFPESYDEKTIRKRWKDERRALFPQLINRLNELDSFGHESVEAEVKAYMADNSLGFGDVLPLLRVMMTGTMQGPPIFEVMALLGQEETDIRLKRGVEVFDEVATNA